MNATTELVLRFCEEFTTRFGYSPTLREIQRGCRLSSTSVVAHHLSQLREAGRVDYVDGAARTVRVLDGVR